MSIAGVFVEPRNVKQIYYNIENFFKVLPNNKLYFFCGKNSKELHIKNINKMNIKDELLEIHELNTNNLNFKTYSELFKSFYILDKIQEEYIFTIQTDGCLCIDSSYNITDFLKYDYIGGYAKQKHWWKETNGLHSYDDFQCFNGGFSLRNKKAMIDVLNNFKPQETVSFYRGCPMEKFPEDLYFVVGMLKLKYNVGMDEYATNFCTHTSYYKKTFCVHKLENYVNKKELEEFLKYCNEYKNFIKLENII